MHDKKHEEGDNEQDWENHYIITKYWGFGFLEDESWVQNMTSNSFSSLVFRL